MVAQADLTARALAAFYDDWRAIASAYPDGECIEGRGVLVAATGFPTAIFNKVFVFGAPEAGWLDDVTRYFASRRVPFSIEMRPHLDDADVRGAGFDRLGEMPFLIWEQPASDWKAIDGIEVSEIGRESLDGFNQAVADGFGMPRVLVDLIDAHITDVEGVRLFAARDGDRIVGTSMSVGGVATGVYTVATIPAYRKRGIGAATTAAAARGAQLAYLQASSMGMPVYQAMGFRLVESAGLFALPGVTW